MLHFKQDTVILAMNCHCQAHKSSYPRKSDPTTISYRFLGWRQHLASQGSKGIHSEEHVEDISI